MTSDSWWPPFEGLDGRRRGFRLLVLVAVLLVSGGLMLLALPDGDKTIVGFELAGDAEAPAYLDAWRDAGLWRVALAVVLDFPFLVAYGFGGALIIDWLADRSRPLSNGWARFLGRFAWLMLVAAAFDVLENLALFVVVTERVDGWPDRAETLATVKFALLDVAYVGAAVAVLSAVIARFVRRSGR